jgi:hypothetical protein
MSLMVLLTKVKDTQRQDTDQLNICEVTLKEMSPQKKAFLVLRYPSSMDLGKRLIENADYLIDKIKIIINKKGEICLISTEHTVMIEYRRLNQNEEDT